MLAALMDEQTAAKMVVKSDERSAEKLVSKLDGISAARKELKKETKRAEK